MRFSEYIKDKVFYLSVSVAAIAFIGYLLAVFRVNASLMFMVLSIMIICLIIFTLYGYYRRKHFYNELLSNVERLDKAYLVLETLSEPEFLDGKILCNALYDIDKSMTENVKELELHNEQFKEYIEMWIHEVKLPLAALSLRIHNSGRDEDKKNLKDIRRIENYVEQVLYYARSENAEKDYRIAKTALSEIVRDVALKYKDDLLESGIELVVDYNTSEEYVTHVITDMKWITFILGQIMNNSIKYKRDNVDSYIHIWAENKMEDRMAVCLYIEDNGIGIPSEDIGRVFEKSFTGYNGRIRSKSTGMGLHITKELCRKLGHSINIESEQGEYTRVCITFHNN
ncbi:MAG: sensor histidine kinase [Lachnospiraceae bacterium]|nr:sensor histidine kinase [Lachnospiraceae bacterium]